MESYYYILYQDCLVEAVGGGYLLGGLLDEILRCNAGGVGLIPVQGTKIPHAVEQVSLHIVTTESVSHTREVMLCTTAKEPRRYRQDSCATVRPGTAK